MSVGLPSSLLQEVKAVKASSGKRTVINLVLFIVLSLSDDVMKRVLLNAEVRTDAYATTSVRTLCMIIEGVLTDYFFSLP
mgnify:FL=1